MFQYLLKGAKFCVADVALIGKQSLPNEIYDFNSLVKIKCHNHGKVKLVRVSHVLFHIVEFGFVRAEKAKTVLMLVILNPVTPLLFVHKKVVFLLINDKIRENLFHNPTNLFDLLPVHIIAQVVDQIEFVILAIVRIQHFVSLFTHMFL